MPSMKFLTNLDVAMAIKRRNLDEAIAYCDGLVEADPHTHMGYVTRAGFMHIIGRYEDSILNYSMAIAITPNSAVLHYARAEVEMKVRKYEDAVRDLTRAIELKDSWLTYEPLLLRAECCFRLGWYDKARADCAAIPDDYVSFDFRGYDHGTKQLILDDIAAALKSAPDGAPS